MGAADEGGASAAKPAAARAAPPSSLPLGSQCRDGGTGAAAGGACACAGGGGASLVRERFLAFLKNKRAGLRRGKNWKPSPPGLGRRRRRLPVPPEKKFPRSCVSAIRKEEVVKPRAGRS